MQGLHDEAVEYRTHFRWASLFVLAAFTVLAARFFQIQVVDGERYETLAMVSHVVRDRVVPARGTIRDRNGELLAMDVEVTDLMVVPAWVKDVDGEVGRLVDLGVFDAVRAGEIRDMIAQALEGPKRSQRLVVHKGLVGSRCPADLSPMTFDPVHGKLVCARCGAEHVDQRAVVQTHLHELPGFSLRARTVRHYPAREVTAHAVGFVNEASAEEVERSGGRFQAGDVVGRSGVERALDAVLRGVPGEDAFVRGPGGRRVPLEELPEQYRDLRVSPPVPGRDVTLTLDMALQKAAVEALSEYPSGAIVALDAHTGEVLAMASWPSFDPGPVRAAPADSSGRPADPVYAPMMNKAVSAYPCGSTFKMITAIAALNEGLVAEDSESWCPGYYVFRGHRFRCFRQYGHGKVRLVRALAESCDTYFYQLGELLGQDNLAHYARDVFGLGEKTGIELAEDPGLVPTERWYRRHRGFQPGFAINTAVGQGDVRVTPLALARAYAALVNGGMLMRPHLVKAIADPVTGEMRPVEPEVVRMLDIPETYVEAVMAGLYGAVNSEAGTARSARIREIPYAGKTGTAQARETRKGVTSSAIASWLLQDHAWFVAYAPAKRPKIVVAAFIEHGGFGGAVAAPAAKKVIQAYYAEHADELSDLWQGGDLEPGEELEIVH